MGPPEWEEEKGKGGGGILQRATGSHGNPMGKQASRGEGGRSWSREKRRPKQALDVQVNKARRQNGGCFSTLGGSDYCVKLHQISFARACYIVAVLCEFGHRVAEFLMLRSSFQNFPPSSAPCSDLLGHTFGQAGLQAWQHQGISRIQIGLSAPKGWRPPRTWQALWIRNIFKPLYTFNLVTG